MAEWLVSPIVSDLGLESGDTVLAFVNGMGGTPLIELYVAYDSVARILAGQGITIGRSLVGNYITSLEMAGFSVTLLQARRRAHRAGGTRRSTPRPCAGASDGRPPRRPAAAGHPPSGPAAAALVGARALVDRARLDSRVTSRSRGCTMIDVIDAWLRLAADPAPRPGARADRARPGHRRRRPRHQHGPRVQRPSSRCSTAGRPRARTTGRLAGDAPADGRPDAHQHRRRRGRAAVRHGAHAGRRGGHGGR